MATTTTTTRSGSGGGTTGSRPRVQDLSVEPRRRGWLSSELAIGVAVVGIFAIAGVLWHLSSLDRVAAVALTSPVARGEAIDTADLETVYVGDGGSLALLAPADTDQVVGSTAVADLPAGTLITESLVFDPTDVGADESVVGLSLEPGQYPVGDLAPGDEVAVVTSEEGREVAQAQVFSVQDLASAERKLISLRASQEDADAVAALDPATVRLVWRVTP